MGELKAVSDELYRVLLDTQKIPEFKKFCLVGGTNLALRYQHRVSVDIDLFTDEMVDYEKFNRISKFMKEVFGDKLKDERVFRDAIKNPSYICPVLYSREK